MLLFAGILLFARLVCHATAHGVWTECRRAGPLVVLVFIASGLGHFLHSLGWRLLLPPGARPSISRSYRIFLAAQAGNEVGLGVFGEPLKVTSLPAEHRDAAIAAVVMDNATALVALVLFFASGVALADLPFGGAVPSSLSARLTPEIVSIDPVFRPPERASGTKHSAKATPVISSGVLSRDRPSRALGPAIALAILAAIACIGWLISRRASANPRPALLERARRALGVCRTVVRERPSDVAFATGFHYAGKLWIIAEFIFVLALLGAGSAKTGALLGIASAAGSAIGAPVPGQIGVVESAISGAAALAGISASTALAVALIRRVRGCIWVLVGALSFPRT